MKAGLKTYAIILLALWIGGCCTPVSLLTHTYSDADVTSISSLTGKDKRMVVDNSCKSLAGTACNEEVQSAVLRITANTGDVYNYGTIDFKSTIDLDLFKDSKSGDPVVVASFELEIDEEKPEVVYVRDISSWYDESEYWEAWIEISGYSNATLIGSNFNLQVTVDKILSPSPRNISDPAKTLITSYSHSDAAINPLTFFWETPCNFNSYEFQLLRLYNTDEAFAKEEACKTAIDWSDATSILTSEKQIELTIGEGSGLYAWRVRPIGNRSEGGYGNSNNWGVWNIDYEELEFDKATDSYEDWFFYHKSLGDDLNWIFTRFFTEQARQTEQVTYYNGLLFQKQWQRHLFADSLNLVTQSFYDYCGRPCLSALSVSAAFSDFRYASKLLSRDGHLFGPAYYDTDDYYDAPMPATGGMIQDYWSDNNMDLSVPSADGYPFSRTIFYSDGTNKPKEVSVVGKAHKLGAGRTIKTYFTSAAESELISMFGDEAPAAKDVFKTIVIDPNKTKTVAYTDKEGKRLATHLLLNGDTLVDTLASGIDAMRTTSTEVTYDARIDEFTVKSKQNFVWTSPTDVTIEYEITPHDIEEACGNYCSSCDYEIEIFTTNLEDGTRSVLDQHTIPAGTCTEHTPWTYQETRSREGEWEIGRIISVANENTTTRNTYLEEHLTSINTAFESSTSKELDALLIHLKEYDLQLFYEEIAKIDPKSTEKDGIVYFKAGCCEFQVPKMDCDEDCPSSGDEFEKLLIDTWGPGGKSFTTEDERTLNYGCNVYEYFFEPLELTDRRSKYPEPAIEEYYAEFKGIEYAATSGYFNIKFSLKSCNGQVDQDWEWSSTYFSLTKSLAETIAEAIQDKISDAGIREYIAYPVGSTIRIIPDYSVAADGGAFTSPSAALSLSVNGSGLAYNSYAAITHRLSGVAYPAGNGAFAKLVDNMLADGYDTCQLWYCWQSLVNNYDSLSYEGGDPSGKRKPFDLLETFLQCTGKQYEDFCTNPYYDGKSGGYLDKAHRFFYFDSGTKPEFCTYDPSWPPDDRDADLYSGGGTLAAYECDFMDSISYESTSTGTKYWEEFYTCLVSEAPATDDLVSDATGIESCSDVTTEAEAEACLNELIGSMKDSCLSYCEQRLDGFYQEVLSYYESLGMPADSCLALCKAYTMVDSCKANCEFSVADFVDIYGKDPAAVLDETVVCDIVEGLVASLTYEWEYAEPTVDSVQNVYWIPITEYIPKDINEEGNENIEWIPFYSYVKSLVCPEGYGLYYDYLFSELLCYIDSINALILDYDHISDASVYVEIFRSALPTEYYNQLISCYDFFETAPKPAWLYSSEPVNVFLVEPCALMIEFTVAGTAVRATELLCDDFLCLKSCPVCIKTVSPQFEIIDTISIETCEQETSEYLANLLEDQLEDCRDSILDNFEENYLTKCGDPGSIDDLLTVSYGESRYHFTLYYYDRAGNLVTTVPPKGADVNESFTRAAHPGHTFKTIYNYDSFGQLIQSESPDGGKTNYWYNDIGLLRFSQNAKQLKAGKYSYIKYDNRARLVETGETDYPAGGLEAYCGDLDYPTSAGTERTFTVYTTPGSVTYLDGTAQRFLRNNVSYVYNDDSVYTYYSYDPHGNVEWMIQDLPVLGKNYIRYEYDLISRLVTEVKYNEGLSDQFFHRYTYDADNRLREVQTSADYVIWDTDARYEYYGHAPLKRVLLGEDYVQGLDYIYTIQGWLKSINHVSLEPADDPALDGVASGTHALVAKDAHAVTLSYYNDDFRREYGDATSPFNASDDWSVAVKHPMYDGNISVQVTNNAVPAGTIRYGSQATAFNYRYDELGRLLQSTFNYFKNSEWATNHEYQSQYSYDANGNILTLDRNGVDDTKGLEMDRMTYHYPTLNNRLDYIDDAGAGVYDDDFEDQWVGNYDYDELGNMISDAGEGIKEIQWNLEGKVKRILKEDGSELSFGYDALGNRAWKTYTASGVADSTTYYVRSAVGQPLAIYPDYGKMNKVNAAEWMIYGSSRIGSRKADIATVVSAPWVLPVPGAGSVYRRELGSKSYELNNHLGNVQTVISDIKLCTIDASGLPGDFKADLENFQSYYPYGSQLPDNSWSASLSRYGFNGMEKDKDKVSIDHPIKYDFKTRMYDSRVARWLNEDPVHHRMPNWSPYAFAYNNPELFIDPSGNIPEEYIFPLLEQATPAYLLDNGDIVYEVSVAVGAEIAFEIGLIGVDANLIAAEIANIQYTYNRRSKQWVTLSTRIFPETQFKSGLKANVLPLTVGLEVNWTEESLEGGLVVITDGDRNWIELPIGIGTALTGEIKAKWYPDFLNDANSPVKQKLDELNKTKDAKQVWQDASDHWQRQIDQGVELRDDEKAIHEHTKRQLQKYMEEEVKLQKELDDLIRDEMKKKE